MRVLVIAGGFPTKEKPDELVFVYNQVCQLAQYTDITMIVPVPVFLFSKRGIYIREKRKLEAPKNLNFKVYFTCFYILFGRLGIHFYAYSQFLSVLITVLLHKIKTNIIHGHFLYPEGFAAVLLGKLLNKPVINTAHRVDLLVYAEGKNMVGAMTRFAVRQTDKIICVAEMLREKAVYFGAEPEKIEVIPNGVDTEVFSPLSTETARKITGLDLDAKVVLFIGQLIERKGIQILLESIPEIVHSIVVSQPILCNSDTRVDESPRSHQIEARASTYPADVNLFTEHHTIKTPVLFVILGEGILQKQLRQRVRELRIENYVQFLGVKENKELPVWINSANLICLPSFSEGLPCVLIEALACGKPVVATRVGGIQEIIQNENFGISVPPGDVEELTSAIIITLKRDWDREKTREYAVAQYDWKTVAQQILIQYRTLQ